MKRMTMVIFLLLVLCRVHDSDTSIKIETRDRCTDLTRRFLHPPKNVEDHPDLVTIVIVGSDKISAREGSNRLARLTLMPRFIANDPVFNSTRLPRARAFFIFAENVTDVHDTFAWLSRKDFWRPGSVAAIFICGSQKNTEFLRPLMEFLWTEQRILNFAVMFEVDGELVTYRYDPFEDQIINMSYQWNISYLFTDKLNNIKQYNMNVTLYDNPPYAMKMDHRWLGQDYEVSKLLTDSLNGTLSIVERYINFDDSVHKNLINDSDLCGVRQFFSMELLNGSRYYDVSYPLEMDELFVLAPIAGLVPQYENITTTFHPLVWHIILILFLLITVVLKLAYSPLYEASHPSIIDIVLLVCSGLIGRTVPNFNRNRNIIKLFLLQWGYMGLIFTTAFQTSLISKLLTPRFRKNIATLEELKASQLKIYVVETYAKQLPAELGLEQQLIVVNRQQFSEIVDPGKDFDTSIGYVINNFVAKFFKRGDLGILDNIKHQFFVLDIPLVYGYNVYLFSKHSPYLAEADNFILRLRQYGLTGREEIFFIRQLTQKKQSEKLGLFHLQSAFYLLLIGYGITAIVFLFEMLNKK